VRRLVWTSDAHLGLTTDNIDRTPDIYKTLVRIFKYANKHAYYLVIGGDIFDSSNPSEKLIALFLRLLGMVPNVKRIFVIDGNHEKYARKDRYSCLQFLEEIDDERIVWIHDVKSVRAFKSETGNCIFSFFPHINKVHIPKKYKTAQKYVDKKAKDIVDKISFFSSHIVFSHLNVRGVVPGSESDMLKKSEVFLPDHFHTRVYLDKPLPIAINGHIHTKQKNDFAHIVGSPVYVGFGEKEKHKYFLELFLPEKRKEKFKMKYHKTKCRRFVEIEREAIEKKLNEKAIIDKVKKVSKNSIIKLSIRISEENNTVNWKLFKKKLDKVHPGVRSFTPSIIRKAVKRNSRQKANLSPEKAVKVFIKANKPKRSKEIMKLAKKYIGRLE